MKNTMNTTNILTINTNGAMRLSNVEFRHWDHTTKGDAERMLEEGAFLLWGSKKATKRFRKDLPAIFLGNIYGWYLKRIKVTPCGFEFIFQPPDDENERVGLVVDRAWWFTATVTWEEECQFNRFRLQCSIGSGSDAVLHETRVVDCYEDNKVIYESTLVESEPEPDNNDF